MLAKAKHVKFIYIFPNGLLTNWSMKWSNVALYQNAINVDSERCFDSRKVLRYVDLSYEGREHLGLLGYLPYRGTFAEGLLHP